MTKDKREIVFQRLKPIERMSELELAGKCESTIDRLFLETAISEQNIRNNLAKLEQEGRAYIVAWTVYRAAVWAAGRGVSVPKPRGMTSTERSHKKRENMRKHRAGEIKEGDATRTMRSRRRIEDTIERARRRPMKWYSSLESA